MNKLLLIAFSNLKKKKGEAFTIGLLLALASLLIYASLSTLFNLDKNVALSYDNSNLADYEIILPSEMADTSISLLVEESAVTEIEINEGLHPGSAKFYYGDDFEKELEIGAYFFSIEDTYYISRITADVDMSSFPKNGIILTKYQEKAQGFKKGETVKIKFRDNTYEFEVVDFSEDGMVATPLNVGVSKLYISQEMYDILISENNDLQLITDVKTKCVEGTDGGTFEHSYMEKLYKAEPALGNSAFYSLSWDTMLYGVEMMPQISMMVILTFAILLILIVIAVICYNIRNFLEENMTTTGILKASGYTGKELNFSLTLQFAIITAVGSLLGVIVGISCSKPLGGAVAALMGVEWRVGPDMTAAIIAVLSVISLVSLIVLILGRRYNKIFVLDALRGGISTHNFKNNAVALDKSALSLPASLAFKGIFFEKGKSLSVALIMGFLSFTCCSSIFIYKNFGTSNESIMRMSGVEMRSIYVTGDTRYGELDPLSIEGVTDYIYGNNGDYTLRAGENESTANVDYWDDPSKLLFEQITEGRLPENEKEIVLAGSIKKELGVKIGDIVYIDNGETSCDYMVVGFDQKINHFGRKAMVTMDGIKRLVPTIEPAAVYLGIEEGKTFDNMQSILEEAYPNGIPTDGDSTMNSVISGVTYVMYLICLAFLVLTYIIVFFILYMIGKSRIIEQKKQLGIYKALGLTTSQLVYKNIIGIIPLVALGGLIGFGLTYVGANPLITLLFSAIGFGKATYPHTPALYVFVIALLILDAVIVTLVQSGKIRKIEPVKMIRE